MAFTSSCHCGELSATVAGELPGSAMSCNCSICRRKGHLLHFVPASETKLSTPADKLGDYTFNNHVIHHNFCTTCGCSPFGSGKDGDGNEMVAINLRCVDECDLDALEISEVDGASL